MRTYYPRFLFGLSVKRDEIPIFTYHEADPAGFARDLEFLARNGYRTLSLDEFLQCSSSAERARSVLLTFDDARKSFWDVGVPLLREFRARATLFVPTYWMNNPPLRNRPATDLFMSWEQVRASVESGLVDVQVHAHRHALVHTSDRLVGFADPQSVAHYDVYDWPMRNVDGAEELGYPALGTPVYRASPLLSARHRFVEDGELARYCQQFVEQNGGPVFFTRPDWRQQLRSAYETRRHSASNSGHRMATSEFRKLVASEFEECRAQFRLRLGYEPKYLAYPWMLGSPLSLELAKSAGISAAFGVALDYRRARDRRLPMPVFGRLQAQWLHFLPGHGRASLSGMIARKIAGFSETQNLAH